MIINLIILKYRIYNNKWKTILIKENYFILQIQKISMNNTNNSVSSSNYNNYNNNLFRKIINSK